MKSKIFTMASAKGGSGKTLLSACFSAYLSELGKKVLMIDSDSTTNGLTLMYLREVLIEKEIIVSKNKRPNGLFDFFENSVGYNIVKLDNGVSLIPATFNYDSSQKETLEQNKHRFFDKFHLILMEVRNKFDYIFIDAQAGSDFFAEIAVNKDISDEVIIVSEYDPLSAAGVERLKGIFREDLTYNRTWYLLNKMIPEFIQSFSDFLEIAKYLNPIPWDADVVRAYARRKLPLDFENGNEFTIAIILTLKTLLGEEVSREIDEWKKQKVSLFKLPIDSQYNYLKERLSKLETAEKKIRLIRLMIVSILTLVVISGAYYLYKTSFLQEIEYSITIMFASVASVFAIWFQRYFDDRNEYNKTIEKDVLYDKLKKLEALKYSDFDSIVRDRKSSERQHSGL